METVSVFFASLGNIVLGVVALAVFFGVMAGVYWMNQNERNEK